MQQAKRNQLAVWAMIIGVICYMPSLYAQHTASTHIDTLVISSGEYDFPVLYVNPLRHPFRRHQLEQPITHYQSIGHLMVNYEYPHSEKLRYNDSAFFAILEQLPYAQTAEIYVIGDLCQDEPKGCQDSVYQAALQTRRFELKVRDKATIKGHCYSNLEAWNDSIGFFFPAVDTLVYHARHTPVDKHYILPCLGQQADSLKAFLIYCYSERLPKDGIPTNIQELKHLRSFSYHYVGDHNPRVPINSYAYTLPESFKALTQLEELVMWGHVWRLPKNTANLDQLKKVEIVGYTTGAEVRQYLASSQLQSVSIHTHPLNKTHFKMGHLQQLKLLDLSGLRRGLPKGIEQLTELHTLKINSKGTAILPKTMKQFKQLEVLHLNRVRRLPKDIGKVSRLRDISITPYKGKTLPKGIGTLPTLEKLFLSGLKLKRIPKSFLQLKLKELCLVGQTKSVPDGFFELEVTEYKNLAQFYIK